jgi:hypothetical protein
MEKKDAAQEAPAMHTELITRDLECALTPEDTSARAAQLLKVSEERQAEEGRAGTLRSEAATLKSRAKERDAEALEEPFGKPDRQGQYWYQRFGDDVQALPAETRDLVCEMTLLWPYKRLDAVRRLLDRYCKAHIAERDNWHEAMGR